MEPNTELTNEVKPENENAEVNPETTEQDIAASLEAIKNENKELKEFLDTGLKAQRKYNRCRNIFTIITAAACAGMFLVIAVCALTVVPKVNSAISSVKPVMEKVEPIVEKIDPVIADIDSIANQIEGERLEEILDAVTVTVKKIEQIDIEKLNEAIANLNRTIKPLADFFEVLGG